MQDPKLLTKIMNVLKSEGIDVDAKREAIRPQYYEQYKRDWYKQNPDAERRMGADNAEYQAHLRAEERLKTDLDEEVAAYYFGDVAAELGLGNIVGDGTLDRIMSKAKGAVGVADTDRNLSNRVLSAIAKYNRVQNRKALRAEAEAKKTESAKNKKASKTETVENVSDKLYDKMTMQSEDTNNNGGEVSVREQHYEQYKRDWYNQNPNAVKMMGEAIADERANNYAEQKLKEHAFVSEKSKSQTSAKKSKGKTADTVYKKNTKLKVGDTVGEVMLVADSETGAPVTPRLSASFAREDMPSYIMATIESLGDDQLISALEEEMLLMSSDSEAELGLHDTIEELSDHVRDGEITPEQAAQVLSDELANPTGADIDTLVERAKLDGVKYMVGEYNKPITVKDVEALRTIDKVDGRPKSISQFTSEDIDKAQKWAYKFYKEIGVKSPFFRSWFGDWRAKDKNKVTVADIPKYIATNEARKAQRGIVINKDTVTNKEQNNGWEICISREGETNTISHSGSERMSEYGLSGIRSLIENAILLDSEVHEHHSNNAKNDLISFDHKLYSIGANEAGDIGLYKITVEEYYQSKKEPSNKRFHNLRYIEKIADIPGGRTFDNNRSGGSTDGKSTINYSISDLFKLVKQYDKDFHYKPVDPVLLNEDGTPKVFYHGTSESFTAFSTEEIASREGSFFFAENREDAEAYGDNVLEVYLQGKKLADYDNQPSEFYHLKDKRAQVEYLKNKGYDGWYADMDSDGWGEVSVFSPGQIKSATNNIGTFDETNSDYRYFLGDDTDTVPAVDVKARAENIIRLADMLQDGAKNDAEYAALSKVKNNAENIVQKYGELVTTKYDNIKAATDAGVPLTLVASMMTYFANVEPIKDSKGKTVKYQGSDGATAKTKADLMEEWLDTTGHERYNGTMVRITDTMRHYMYAIMYPKSKNPFKTKK